MVSIIAAIGKNNELGLNNNLIWHLSGDMKFFKTITTGKTVIMGRKCFESLPNILPNRKNIIITSNLNYKASGATIINSITAPVSSLIPIILAGITLESLITKASPGFK